MKAVTHVALVAVALGGLGSLAHADKADQLFKKGKKLLAEKKYPEACAAFEESDKADPGIGAKLNVARCYEEWGKLATALRWYSDAKQMAEASNDERTQRIQGLIAELDPKVPRLTVTAPAGAKTAGMVITLDGAAFATSSLGSEQRVDPGPHEIVYTIDGVKRSKVVPLERGGSSEIALDTPAGQGSVVSEPAAPVDHPEPMNQRRLLGLGAGGVGVIALGVSIGVTLHARSNYNSALTADCNGASDMCDAAGLSATHSARHQANVSSVVALLGLAAIGGGAYLYFGERGSHAEHAMYVAPSVGDANGVVLGGRF